MLPWLVVIICRINWQAVDPITNQWDFRLLIEKGFSEVVLVGEEFSKTNRPTSFLSFEKTAEAREHLEAQPVNDRQVLVKGSRGIALEGLKEVL